MMEFLQFCFQSFWHFAGVVLMICVIGKALERVISAAFKKGNP